MKSVRHLEVNINKYAPLNAASYIDLPSNIRHKKACVNVQNIDDECFKWSILAALHPVDSCNYPELVTHYRQYENELNFTDLEFPMCIKDISKFESLNNISVNVFGIEQNFKTCNSLIVGPIHHTKLRRPKHINLLYIDNNNTNHYVWIKDMSRLINNQVNKNEHKKWLCDGCLIFLVLIIN